MCTYVLPMELKISMITSIRVSSEAMKSDIWIISFVSQEPTILRSVVISVLIIFTLSTESAEYVLLQLLKMSFIALSMLPTTSRFPSGSFCLVELKSGNIPSCIHSKVR